MKPTNTIKPTITSTNPYQSGEPWADHTMLEVSDGGWDHNPTSFAYAWKSFDGLTTGDNATVLDTPANLSEEHSKQYYPLQGDTGKCLLCIVTATNADGSTDVRSVATSFVIGKPVCTNGPTITPQAGGITGGSPGVAPVPTVFSVNSVWYHSGLPTLPQWPGPTYKWRLANADGSIANVDAHGPNTGQTYTVDPADIGSRLYCEVTATTALGSTVAMSDFTDVLVQALPIKLLGGFQTTVSTDPSFGIQQVQGGWYQYVPQPPYPGPGGTGYIYPPGITPPGPYFPPPTNPPLMPPP